MKKWKKKILYLDIDWFGHVYDLLKQWILIEPKIAMMVSLIERIKVYIIPDIFVMQTWCMLMLIFFQPFLYM